MSFFQHPQALCESENIGEGTRVWAFAHILPGAVIGKNCNICDGVFIENDVIVGNDVTVKCGVQLWDGVRLGDGVFVGPNATFTNDKFPRSGQQKDEYPRTIVQAGASIGANATILPGITIGAGAMIGAGSVVTRDVPPYGVVVGNPGRLKGYANTTSVASSKPDAVGNLKALSSVKGVKLIDLVHAADMRGSLVAGDIANQIPFAPERFFVVYDVPSAELRGEHAHHACQQFLVCLKGSVSAIVDDGEHREEYLLNRPDIGLFMPELTWGTQYRYSTDCVLLVLASRLYDNDDYIRNYDDFLSLTSQRSNFLA